jgi:nucleoside-diphosphate-sugar epimerase
VGSDLEQVKVVFSYYSDDSENLFKQIEWVEADLNDIPKLTLAFENISHVYHCAALISFDPSDYKLLRKTNIKGTANIVNLCSAFSVKKLCYLSSIATLGYNPKRIDEETHWSGNQDQSVYAISKYGAEMEVWRGTQEGISTVILNPGVVLGPGFWSSGSGLLFKMAKKGKSYATKGITGYVAVQDVTTAMMQLMNSSIENQRYILADDHLSYLEIMQMISKELNRKPPTKIASPFSLALAWRIDWLASKLLGRKRRLTKQLSISLQKKSVYSSEKIKQDLEGFTFTPITDSVSATCRIFLKEVCS